ncbi:B12-binding domain-containing radical SAM protein [Tindallia californiensis]|uniref:Radical SAM superfamily enzyme YgiQ, UPF0313 family n=1 Tax=Tindallia californiensis TaxID=159292 RepID=A0A1H3JL00_9FIRM|nr:B12-binding domain-containing radical SAM protein [Tindallia californiensis]SDY40078.1 Radical SAM superfamily enzyme YgiQ, UPF0313 family [Tindallia californiensis]
MKILLIGINAKFIHTNLAIRYLAKGLSQESIENELVEYTINQHMEDILQEIYLKNCDIVGFSCYIWNIELIKKIVSSLKKLKPDLMILLGGPEVSCEPYQFMVENEGVDLILMGDGEERLPKLIHAISNYDDYSELPGLVFRAKGDIFVNEIPYENKDNKLLQLPDPYTMEDEFHPEKIYYYETSRGCPYQCSFCLSGSQNKLSYLPMHQLKKVLLQLISKKVKQVKLVDRTFNSDGGRAYEIFDFLIRNDNGYTNFHFEIGGELINNELMSVLELASPGLFQFEIGIQSTNEETLQEINRNPRQQKLMNNIQKLIELKTIHIHVDLIAGLPYESYFQFRESFDSIFDLKADMIQLGFLKLIKGSEIKQRRQEYGYIFMEHPPYEVLSNDWISYSEIIRLKNIEKMLNLFWNSGSMRYTLEFISLQPTVSMFRIFDDMSRDWHQNKDIMSNYKYDETIEFLESFLMSRFAEIHKEIYYLMHLDYYKKSKRHKAWYGQNEEKYPVMLSKEDTHLILHDEAFVRNYLPQFFKEPVKKFISKVQIMLVPSDLESVMIPFIKNIGCWEVNKNNSDYYQLNELLENHSLLLFQYEKNQFKRLSEYGIKMIRKKQ